MIPRNQSRLKRHRNNVKKQGLRLLIMFMTFAFWTGYIMLMPDHMAEKNNLLAEGLPGQISAPGFAYTNINANEGFWQRFGETAMQAFLGKGAMEAAIPWIGEELLWSRSLNTVAAVGPFAEIVADDGILEEDYTLLEDPYAAGWPEYPEEQIMSIPQGEPRVLIYHTHNSEDYVPDGSGQTGATGVIGAARVLAQQLESRYGIKTAHSEAVNDRPDFTKSYLNSFNVVSQFLQKYPDLETIIDVHRDAGFDKREDTLVIINGKPCAKLLLVMGNAYESYDKNLAFAKKVKAKADEMYPGLMKPLRIADKRRYNQQLHPQAILLEVGSNLNYQTDAENSMVLFADVLAAVLNE